MDAIRAAREVAASATALSPDDVSGARRGGGVRGRSNGKASGRDRSEVLKDEGGTARRKHSGPPVCLSFWVTLGYGCRGRGCTAGACVAGTGWAGFSHAGPTRHPRLHRHRPQARPRRLPSHPPKTRHHHSPSTGVNAYRAAALQHSTTVAHARLRARASPAPIHAVFHPLPIAHLRIIFCFSRQSPGLV